MPYDAETPTRPLLARTWKGAALVIALSLAATQYMASHAAKPIATASLRDPETTGALGPAASLRLDPCAVPARR
jgi:hypothetical protein